MLIKPEQKLGSRSSFKLQDQRRELPSAHGYPLPFLNNPTTPAYASIRVKTFHQARPGAMWEENKDSTLNNPVMVGRRARCITPYKFDSTFYNLPSLLRLRSFRRMNQVLLLCRRSSVHPFTITLPTFAFGVTAFTEAGECNYEDEDEDDMVEDEHADVVDDRRCASTSSGSVPSRGGRQRLWERRRRRRILVGKLSSGRVPKGK
jgi:hypothetical protein